MKTVLVVAGNKSQFDSFMGDFSLEEVEKVSYSAAQFTLKDGTRYIYVSDPIKMKGFRGVETKFIGTFYELKNLDEFEREARFASYK